jgi:hypothetical protein
MIKIMQGGVVAQQFSHANLSTAAQGDLVGLVGSMQVDSIATGRPIGVITTISPLDGFVVVELFSAQIREAIAGTGGITAGNQLKLSAKNTVVPATPGTVETDAPLAFGIALNTVTAGGTVFYIPKG